MTKPGMIFGIVGALAAFPRRLAARAVEAAGGQLRRGINRQTTHVVIGRKLIDRLSDTEIEAKLADLRQHDATLMSERGFLAWLRLLDPPQHSSLSRASLLDQSRLDAVSFDMLALFDAFEHSAEPFSFRDLILARKYAGLVAGGATWGAIARSIHRSGPVTSLTALSLHHKGDRLYVTDGEAAAEMDGQRLLDLAPSIDESEDYFARAEALEANKLHAEAGTLYERCLSIDPTDSVAAFNLANCLKAMERPAEAALAYARAIKLDPGFAEAWFNFAGLLRDQQKIAPAREHLNRAIAIDPGYADAIYNLATLEYEAHNLREARRWWLRYLELDDHSDWARKATRGIAYIDHELRKSAG
jgi:tetratricopeptide (TPR) repeat protein